MTLFRPGAVLGLLGGGQLARMTAMAARQLGLRVAVLDPDPGCAAAGLADRLVQGRFDDPAAAARLAKGCDEVTWDTERVSPEAAEAAQREAILRPSAGVLAIVGDRIAQKSWLSAHGFPLARWEAARSPAELGAARSLLGRCRAKSAQGGYDGRGQWKLDADTATEEVFAKLGGCVVEEEVALSHELSVLVARGGDGALGVYPVARNWHVDGVLSRTLLPASLDPLLERRAVELAQEIAAALGIVGLLTVELFVTEGGRLLVNEVAARTHNTFHGTVEGCFTGQFEQLVRVLFDLPLGSTESRTTTLLLNLLGDDWLPPRKPEVAAALSTPGVSVHLYGKTPRPGRKLGHFVVSGRPGDGDIHLRAEQVLQRFRGDL